MRGIAQGAILSPLFCNLYLTEFDNRLAEKNIPFVRFADDFLLFSADHAGATKALDYAGRLLHQLGLDLHPQKTKIVRSGPAVVFLGQRLPRRK